MGRGIQFLKGSDPVAQTMPPALCWCASLAPKRLIRLGGTPYQTKTDRWIRITEEEDDDEDEEEDRGDNNNNGRFIACSKHPASAMFLGMAASTGEVSPPIWFKTSFRLDAEGYIEVLKKCGQ